MSTTQHTNDRLRGPNKRDEESEADGYSEDDLFPGRVRLPHTVTRHVTQLGASPFEIREAARRKHA